MLMATGAAAAALMSANAIVVVNGGTIHRAIVGAHHQTFVGVVAVSASHRAAHCRHAHHRSICLDVEYFK